MQKNIPSPTKSRIFLEKDTKALLLLKADTEDLKSISPDKKNYINAQRETQLEIAEIKNLLVLHSGQKNSPQKNLSDLPDLVFKKIPCHKGETWVLGNDLPQDGFLTSCSSCKNIIDKGKILASLNCAKIIRTAFNSADEIDAVFVTCECPQIRRICLELNARGADRSLEMCEACCTNSAPFLNNYILFVDISTLGCHVVKAGGIFNVR